ncbi:MAG: signal peptidase II, partial [Solirubrobacterales bacterium]
MRVRRYLSLDRAAVTAIAVVAIDQWTKWWAFNATTPGETISVFPGVSIGQTRNEGIAFGFLAGRPLLVFGLMAVALAILVFSYVKHRQQPVLWLATGLLMGGAIGNAIDRVTLGYVRDFIEVPKFPSFNIADIAITVGVVILVLAVEQRHQLEKRLADDREAA